MQRSCLLTLLLMGAIACPHYALADDDVQRETKRDAEARSDRGSEIIYSPSYHSSNKVPVVITHHDPSVAPVTDRHKAAAFSDRGPVVLNAKDYIIDPSEEPFGFLEDGTHFVQDLAARLNFSFMPQMVYTYQHATRVRPGANHGYSYIYTNINGATPLDAADDDPKGHFVYNIQGNSGLGTPLSPFIEESVGSPYFINNVLTGGRLSLKKLWWRQSFMDDTLTINVGKVYYANFFDLNAGAENPTTQFLAAQLTNNTAVPFASYGAGAIGQWQFDDQTSIRFGTMNALSSGRSTGFEKLDRGQLFNMAQFEWSPHTSVGDSTLKGNYRAFMWYSGNDEWYDNAGWGAGVSFDQELGGGFIGFFRWGWAQDGAAPATMCWSGGFVLNGFMGRQNDGIGLGLTFSDLSDSGTSNGDGWETIVEAFWRIQVTRTMQFGPDLQYFSSGESDGVSNTWIWGLRCTWMF